MFTVAVLVLLLGLVIGHTLGAKHVTPRGRKLLYGGSILLLFFAMVFHRDEVEAAAEEHSLRETNIGKVDLGGSTARFVLASFRGPLICLLWWDATELQMKHEFQDLEVRYQSLTKLQPHFTSPWVYQAWNMAYNVSVEFDRVEDKYFWISQGIRWLAEGEQVNRSWVHDPRLPGPNQKKELGDPDMRWHVGYMLQDKLSVSDEVSTHRCFLHLSCTPPSHWDPVRLRQSSAQYDEFVQGHPQLVRQIRLLRSIPEGADRQLKNELLTFFAAHRRLPSLYPNQLDAQAADAKAPEQPKRFPVWPETKWPQNPEIEDNHDPHDIAKEWYLFANEPLPPASLDLFEKPEEQRYYRMPKHMMSVIFRKQPAQAKAHQAMQLGKDGWFEQSQAAWKNALEMWLRFGDENRLELRDYEELMKRDRRYQTRFPEEAAGAQPPPARYRNDPEVQGDFRAYIEMRYLEDRRQKANYVHWKTLCEVSSTDDAVAARRHMYNGNVNRSDFRLALKEYELGLAGWKKLMIEKRPFDPQRDATFLIAVGPHTGFLQAFTTQTQELVKRTTFGEDQAVNDELVELQDQYIRVRSRVLGVNVMHAAQSLWQATNVMGLQVAGATGPAAAVGTPLSPVTMDFAENALLHYVAPLDLYLLPGYPFKSFRFKLPKGIQEMQRMAQEAKEKQP
jgi:hypothetical protein